MAGKVVVNRAVSLDGIIGVLADEVGLRFWPRLTDYMDPADLIEVASETGAMLVGRNTWEVGDRLEEQEPGSVDYPFEGPIYLLTHRPLNPPRPEVPILSGDIRAAVATALAGAGEKNLEILGADVAAQCFRAGLVDEVLIYQLPLFVGHGIRIAPEEIGIVHLEPISSRRSGRVNLMRFRVVKDHN